MLKYCTVTCDEVTKNLFSLGNIQWAIKQRVGLIYWIHSSTIHKLIARKQKSAGQRKWAFAMKPYWNKYDRLKLLSLSGASAFYISMRCIFTPEFEMDSLKMNEKLLWPQNVFGHSSHTRKNAQMWLHWIQNIKSGSIYLKETWHYITFLAKHSTKSSLLGFKW